jgi:hypothetical protein
VSPRVYEEESTMVSRVIRLLLLSSAVLGTVPAFAESTDALALEARVDRVLAQLVNDERYSHLPIMANYDRLRARLLEQACFVADAPCAGIDRIHHGSAMTTEIAPEQAEVLEQLLFTIHSASASAAEPAPHLMVTTAE